MKKAVLLKCLCICFVSLLMSACLFKPFRFDIQQGSIITFDKVAQIKPGMSQDQVQFILGSPTLEDIFHTERWDYLYYLDAKDKPIEKRHFAVYFKNGVVDSITQDDLPYGMHHA